MEEQDFKLKLVETYDRYAQERDQGEPQQWKLDERATFLQMLKEQGKNNLLEIGAGPGRDSKFFQDNGLKVVCTDISPEMVRLCREKGLAAYVMDFYNLEFLDGIFDAVWALNCLLHVPKKDLPLVLTQIQNVLRTDGLLYLGVYGGMDSEGVWDNDYYKPPRFFSFYTDDQIKKVVEEYFELIYFQPIQYGEELHFQSMVLRKRG